MLPLARLPAGDNAPVSIALRAPMGWLGPGRLVEEVLVVTDGATVEYAGPAPRLSRRVRVEDVVRVDGFLMPGVGDRHVHIGLADPGAVVRGGVTAVRDLGWNPDDVFRDAEASEGPFDGPLIRAVGPIITCPGGYPSRAAWAPAGTAREVRGPEEAAAAVREVLGQSQISVIKLALNDDAGPTLSDEELLAICETAHDRDAIVTAHVQGTGQAVRAAGAGVDEFAHCPWSERLPDDLLASIAGRMRMVSTLDIHSYGKDTPELHTALDNLNRFVAAGGSVGLRDGPGQRPHSSGHPRRRESGTCAGPACRPSGCSRRSTFRPLDAGEPADVVVLGGNPLEDLNAYGQVKFVMRAGRRVR